MTHEAGRELDALVAEKVMGYLWWHRPGGRNQLYEPGSAQWATDMDLLPGKHATEYTPVLGAPKYSTDIAAAWEVWSLPQHDDWILQRHVYDGVARHTIYEDFRALEDGRWLAWSFDAPHAICLAALRAVGYEEIPL